MFFGPSEGGKKEPGRHARIVKAKQICASCPVQAACLRYALDNNEEFGIWGGMTERQRRRKRFAIRQERERDQLSDAGADGEGR